MLKDTKSMALIFMFLGIVSLIVIYRLRELFLTDLFFTYIAVYGFPVNIYTILYPFLNWKNLTDE